LVLLAISPLVATMGDFYLSLIEAALYLRLNLKKISKRKTGFRFNMKNSQSSTNLQSELCVLINSTRWQAPFLITNPHSSKRSFLM
jgi:hypothetical protein